MASAVSSLLGSSTGAPAGTASTPTTLGTNAAPNEQMFLQLLVSQLKNQDPLNPADGTQFVSQLAQFSELEQVIAIRGDIESGMSSNSNASNPAGSGNTPANSNLASTMPGTVLPGGTTPAANASSGSQPTTQN